MKKILAMLMALVMLLTVLAACSTEKEEKASPYEVEAARVGDLSYTVADLNYMYVTDFYDLYNNLYYYYGDSIGDYVDQTKSLKEQDIGDGTTWHDYLMEYMENNLKYLSALYMAAKAEGFTLPEEYQQDLDSMQENLEAAAEEYGAPLEEYLTDVCGDGMTYDVLYKMTEINYIANAYAEQYRETIPTSDADVRAMYEANRQSYDKVKICFYEEEYEEGQKEEAYAHAELLTEAETKEEFLKKLQEIVPEEEKENYSDESTIVVSISYDSLGMPELGDWLYDESRVAGDTYIYDESDYGCYLTVMYLESESADYDLVSVRHILIKPEAAEGEKMTEKDWKAAEKKADEIYEQYLSGEKTEEAFSALAKENSADGSAADGGMIADITKGRTVAPFNDWCFDASRKPGDTGIVKSVYGYHIMYFSSTGISNLHNLLDDAVIEDKFSAWLEELVLPYEFLTTEAYENVGDTIMAIAEKAKAKMEAEAAEEEPSDGEETADGTEPLTEFSETPEETTEE